MARGPLSEAAVTVRSGIDTIERCHCAPAAPEVHRRIGQVAGALGAHYHAGAAAVGDQAAVGGAQRVADHPRGKDIIDAQRPTGECLGIQVGPLPGRDRHLGELLACGAVLVHVPAGRQGIGGDRVARLVGRLVPLWLAHRYQAAAGGSLVGAVADQRSVAETGLQCQSGLQQVQLETGAADIGAIHEFRADAEVFGDRQGGKGMGAGGGEDRVDVGKLQAGIGNGPERRLAEQLDGAVARRLADAGATDADDGGLATDGRAHGRPSWWGTNTTTLAPSCSTMRACTRVPIGKLSCPSIRDIMRTPSSRSTSATL